MDNYIGIVFFVIVVVVIVLGQKKTGKKKKAPGSQAASSPKEQENTVPVHTVMAKKAGKTLKTTYQKANAASLEEKRLIDTLDKWDPLEDDRRSLRRRDGRPSYDPDITEQVLGIFH